MLERWRFSWDRRVVAVDGAIFVRVAAVRRVEGVERGIVWAEEVWLCAG